MKFFLSYFKPHIHLFVFDLICAAFISAVDLAFPVLTRYSINTFLPQKQFNFFYIIIAIMIGLYVLRMAANYFVTYFGHLFGARVEKDMRRDIFNHIEKQSFRFFDNHRTAKLMSHITNDLSEITELAHHGPEDVFISLLTLIGALIIMLNIRPELALMLFLFLPLLSIHTFISRKKLGNSSTKVKEEIAEINATIESSISGARVTKVFTNEEYEKIRFAKSNHNYYLATRLFYRSMSFFICRLEFFMDILRVLIIAVGGYFIMKDKMNLADLIAATLFIANFLAPIRRLANFVEQYSRGMAGFNRFKTLMNTSDETPQNLKAQKIQNVRGNITYNNVSFAYNSEVNVLKNINLSIKAGQTIAFVGPSGSGKTTLCNLLPRFYELQAGSITLDEKDIRDIDVQSLRKHIGIVQQDVFLFATTIKDNIAYGNINASDEEIIKAAKMAEIHEEIIKMPDGYNTLVGERGMRLSGGQKQRISIARIFLKNPPILILDEATSALDTETEIKIQKSFEKLAKGRTNLIIAHRLSTIRNADLIVVVNDEGITEIGTHSELLVKQGQYANLYNAQNTLLA